MKGVVADLLLYHYPALIFLESYRFVSVISDTTTNLQHHLNGDGKISLDEAIHALQVLSGVKEP